MRHYRIHTDTSLQVFLAFSPFPDKDEGTNRQYQV